MRSRLRVKLYLHGWRSTRREYLRDLIEFIVFRAARDRCASRISVLIGRRGGKKEKIHYALRGVTLLLFLHRGSCPLRSMVNGTDRTD